MLIAWKNREERKTSLDIRGVGTESSEFFSVVCNKTFKYSGPHGVVYSRSIT
jgi:hypothetical protein